MTDPASQTSAPAILLCPGQGAQHVGMGKAWAQRYPAAADLFDEASAALGLDLRKLCFDGPEQELNRTDIAQAAIYTTSVACYRVLNETREVRGLCAAAGLSLGEFTALHLAGAYDFLTGLRLVRLRGQAMQEAAEASRGGMVALVGAGEAQAEDLCRETLAAGAGEEVLVPANFNCPGQIVISGSLSACERALEVAQRLGLRATPLKVAGAFHSPLMQSAAERLAAALADVKWATPAVPVVSNVTARPHDGHDIASIRQRLVDQLTCPVRWGQSMSYLIAAAPEMGPAGAVRFVELAPGKVLSGLMRRIDRNVKVENYAEPAAQ